MRRHTGHDRTDKEYITNCFARRQRRRRRAFTSRARRFFDTCENAAVVVRLRCVLFWSRATYSRERKKKSNLHMGRFERDRERERGAWVGHSRLNGELFWGGSRKDFQQAIAVSGWGLCLQIVGENANWPKKTFCLLWFLNNKKQKGNPHLFGMLRIRFHFFTSFSWYENRTYNLWIGNLVSPSPSCQNSHWANLLFEGISLCQARQESQLKPLTRRRPLAQSFG